MTPKHKSSRACVLLCPLYVMQLLAVSFHSTSALEMITTIKNLRPVVPGSIYRSATLDELSLEDAQRLLDGCDGRPLAAVIDLRNLDEVKKGESKRTEGSSFFYSSLAGMGNNTNDKSPQFLHLPVLENVDAFWDEAIDRMDAGSRISATLQTAFKGGALDQAAARNLEEGGLPMLYTIMMATASRRIGSVLQACVQESARGPVIFHCQKGKDRTGVVAMLLETCLGASDDEIVEAYAASGDLLGGEESSANAKSSSETSTGASSSSSGTIDWSHFRGSPPSAMVDTMEWIRKRHGSVENYLEFACFDTELQQQLHKSYTLLGKSN